MQGTGRGGRVTKKDILGFIESGGKAAPPAAAPAQLRPSPARTERAGSGREEAPARRRSRAVAARRELRTDDGDAQGNRRAHAALARHVRARHERDRGRHVESQCDSREAEEGVSAELRRQPDISHFRRARRSRDAARVPVDNGEIRGDQIVTRSYVNLGFAVELQDGKGLIVPVVKNAETLNLLGMAKAVADIAQRARDKKLLPDEVQGGTFTITNPGGYGTFHGTPVISQPQAAILGTYAVVKRPWVVQDELGEDVIAIRPIMNLTLTYDHRLVTARSPAASCATCVRNSRPGRVGLLADFLELGWRRSYGERQEPVFFCLVVDRQPQLVAPLVEHQWAERNDERCVDRCSGPEARGAACFELSLRARALAGWNRTP